MASLLLLINCNKHMILALTISHGRMAPCFAGVEICLLSEDENIDNGVRISTHDWHPLSWGYELRRKGVKLLLCSGIDLSTWSGLQGHGIRVIPNIMGDPEKVLTQWRQGALQQPESWPPYSPDYRGAPSYQGGKRRRYRGGQQ